MSDERVIQAIKRVNGNFTSAFNRGDITEAVTVYAEGAILLPPLAERIEGQERIREYWHRAAEKGNTDMQLLTTTVEVENNLAYEVGAFSMKRPDGDETMIDVNGKYVVVWKRNRRNSWQWYIDIWNLDSKP